MEKHHETKYTTIYDNYEWKRYCDFCGKECKNEFEYDHRDRDDYYTCDCDKAKKYVDINSQIYKLGFELRDLQKEVHIDVRRKLAEKKIREIRKEYGLE